MRRFFCWLGFHRPPPGLRFDLCIYFSCTCGALVPGGWSTKKKKA